MQFKDFVYVRRLFSRQQESGDWLFEMFGGRSRRRVDGSNPKDSFHPIILAVFFLWVLSCIYTGF